MPDILALSRMHAEQVSNTSPKVKEEGNIFWKEVVSYFNDDDKIKLFGSIYEYYYFFSKFFFGGPYTDVIKYCEDCCKKIEIENQKKVDETKVSIAISIEDKEKGYAEAIKSVIQQSHKNIEVILIYNGVQCEETEINKWKSEYKEDIKVINHSKKESRNVIWKDVLENTSGDYVILSDQYSMMEKDRVKIQLTKMISSDVVISNTSYYEAHHDVLNLINCGFEDGDVVHKIINSCYYKMPVIMLKKSYLIKENIVDCSEYENVILKAMINNRILGITAPLVKIIIHPQNINMEKRFAAIIHCIIDDVRFWKYPAELSMLIGGYKNILDSRSNEIKKDFDEDSHNEIIDRYKYMLTMEYRKVSEIRCKINKILFRKNVPSYLIDTPALKNNRLSTLYRRYKKERN